MRIELDGLALRPLVGRDVEALALHGNDRAVWLSLRDAFPHPYTPEHGRAFIEKVANGGSALVLGLEVEGGIVGVCGAYPQDDVYRLSAEVGYWVGRAFHGRGLATKALGALSSHVFATTGLVRLHAGVFSRNPASARVLEKCGYVREGVLRSSVVKDGQVLDSWLYSLIRS